jgi:hypothetical protein
MQLVTSVVVKRPLHETWAFLSALENAPKWDRSVARAALISPSMEVGALVETTAPSGMTQRFRVDELTPPHRLRFSLLEQRYFRAAELAFELASDGAGTRIVHRITLAVRLRWLVLVPVLRLVQRRALGADLESLRRALDEGDTPR